MTDRALAGWHRLPNDVDDFMNDLEVALRAATADQVIVTRHAFKKRRAQGTAMIRNVNPVANVSAIAIDRHLLSTRCLANHQGNQFFRKLEWTIVVRAMRGDHRQRKAFEVRARHVIRRSLARTVRTVGRVGRILAKRRITIFKRTVNLIGRNIEENT